MIQIGKLKRQMSSTTKTTQTVSLFPSKTSTMKTDWLPPRDEWDFRAIPLEKCRAACHWEYARSITPRISDVVEYHKKYGDGTILGRLLTFESDLKIPWITLHRTLCRCFSVSDLKNAASLVAQLKQCANPLTSFLWRQLSKTTRKKLSECKSHAEITNEAKSGLIEDLNTVLRGECIYNDRRFVGIKLDGHTRWLIKESPKGEDRIRINRMILEEAFPLEFTRDESVNPIQWKYYNVWSGKSILITPLAEVKQVILGAVNQGMSLESALKVYLNDLDYLLGADFYHHGVTTVIANLKSWARKEARKFPRAKGVESYYDYLKWLAAYRLEGARKASGASYEEIQAFLRAEDRGRENCPDTLPIYASHGAWSKAKSDAARLIKLFKTKPEDFEQKILF